MSKTIHRGHFVKVLLASRFTRNGTVLWTLHLRYWRAIHAELMTHRVFSRNAGSSRAKPVRWVLSQVWNNPAGPMHWGVNQSGMQARAELVGWRKALAGSLWRLSGKVACVFAWGMMKLGLHKQVANRILEPWQYIDVQVTATDWDNFFELRDHPDAQPEFQALARDIAWRMAVHRSEGLIQDLNYGQWHLPWISEAEQSLDLVTKLKLSSARSARISYEPFDGNASFEKECQRHDDLVGSRPRHASPTEHQATAIGGGRYANFQDFLQYRWFLENDVPVRETHPELFDE